MDEHVMISYNQASSAYLAKKINDTLKENNIKTWIDYEHINDDVYRDMASGVDKAFVVLVLITNEYCDSENCYKECSFASRLKKPIIPIRVNSACNPTTNAGPVGLLIGNLLYEDFSNVNSFDKLLRRIRRYQRDYYINIVPFCDNEPNWRIRRDGLCFEEYCKNRQCIAFNQLVIVNKGFGTFKIGDPRIQLSCPICNCKLPDLPKIVEVNKCFWKYYAIALDENEQSIEVKKDEWCKVEENVFHRIKQENFIELIVETKHL